MDLLLELNQSQGTTFLVVTHDLNIARQTQRVLIMADGKIVREDIIGTPIEEDLKLWQHTGLGQRVLAKDETLFSTLNWTEQQVEALYAAINHPNG
jgi:ABC-type dipeptide/oligopeptide/nickel transport system ATPase component